MLILVTFGMLWVPVGQHAFLIPHWMKVGTFLAPFLLFVAVAFRAPDRPFLADLRGLSLVMLVAYIVHQFEEHWIDVFGRPYAFRGSVNELLMGALGLDGEGPLTPAGVFVINTSLVWLVGALAILASPRHVFPALAMAAIIVVNAVAHVASGLVSFTYNPGLLTSLLVFFPVGGFVYRRALVEAWAEPRQIAVSLVWGVLAHILMVGGLVMAGVYGLFSETTYFAALVLWSMVPVFIYTPGQGPADGNTA